MWLSVDFDIELTNTTPRDRSSNSGFGYLFESGSVPEPFPDEVEITLSEQ